MTEETLYFEKDELGYRMMSTVAAISPVLSIQDLGSLVGDKLHDV